MTRSPANIAVFGVGGTQTGVAKSKVTLSVLPQQSETKLTLTAIILPKLTAYTGNIKNADNKWPHLSGLQLADPLFADSDPIDMLLGADVYAAVVRPGLRSGGPQDPVARDTIFGWILSECTATASMTAHATAHQCILGEPLIALVRRFWEQEEFSIAPVR